MVITVTTTVSSCSYPAAWRSMAQDADDVVAVDDLAGVVDGDQPVAVTVEGQPDVGAVLDDGGGE